MTALHRQQDDLLARRLAQTVFDRPIAVEAGAGTGKTTVLVARVLAWCLGQGWTQAEDRLAASSNAEIRREEIAAHLLDGLVAITFTDAAATQMARKIAQALARLATDPRQAVVGFFPELLPDPDPSQLELRARALTGALDHLAVRTIHSHCWNLLATYPMAAGLSPELRVDAEGKQLEEVVREVVETAVKEAYSGPPDHPLLRLALRMVDPRWVADAVHTLVGEGFGSQALDRDPLSSGNSDSMRSRLLTAVTAAHQAALALTSQNRAKRDRQAAEAIEQTEAWLLASSADSDPSSMSLLFETLREIWEDDTLGRLAQWSRGEFTNTVDKLVGEGRGRLATSAGELVRLLRIYRRIDVEILDAGRRAMQPLIATVESELRAQGVLTYSSLMTETWRLLADQPQVRRREQRRLQQLLVDEFQDTDHLQCEIVRFLALDGDEEQRPGLFVVGDPKQSIYGWRDADLAAYEGFLTALEAAGGQTLALDQNFRSVPAILAEVDRSIAPIMTAQPGLQPDFSSLQPCAELASRGGFDRADRSPVEYWVSWTEAGPKTRADDAAHLEASAIAADIRELHDQLQVPWSDFGLLLRSTSRLETFLEAFRLAAVPFEVTSDKHYFRKREIIEAAALVRTILLPVDHLALVTFSRSATVGIPDAALIPLWQRGFPDLLTRLHGPDESELRALRGIVDEVAAQLPADIPGLDSIGNWNISAMAALENLAHLRQALANEPADRFIEMLRHRFLFDATEAARHLGVYRLANLDRFFRDLEGALEEQGGDVQGVLRALQRSIAESAEAEQALPQGAVEEAVRVMTIHGAKGLEFAHVYLPQLHAHGRQNQLPSIKADRRWYPGQDAEYVLFGSPTPNFDLVVERESQIDRAEQVRTLYVAMTRARERLVLLGTWPEDPTPIATARRVTYLDLLRSRESLPKSFSDLESSMIKSQRPSLELDRVRWRFPYLQPLSTGSPAADDSGARLPSAARVREQSSRLDALRIAARARMERSFSATASDEAAVHLRRSEEEGAALESRPFAREIALSVGDAFHRMLETWDLNADSETELDRQWRRHRDRLATKLSSDLVRPAQDRFDSLVGRFRQGQFLERFAALTDQIIGREVPVTLPPTDTQEGPVGYITGFIDLLCRDSKTGEWIIIDYKTDQLENQSEVELRTTAYAAQEAVYTRAVQESLNLDRPPSTQIWFIWPDFLWEDSSIR